LILNLRIFECDRKSRNELIFEEPSSRKDFHASLIFNADSIDKAQFRFSNQQPVLVFDVKSVEGPDAVTIPSFVRLYRIQNALDDLFGGFLIESAINGVFKRFPGVVNRELSVPGSLASVQELNLVCGVVESGSEIVQGIPEDQSEFRRKSLDSSYLEKIVSSLRLSLNENLVSLCIREAEENAVEVIDVFFSSLHF
jgi:hypothetical protein